MYNYHIIHKDNSGRIGLSPSLKSLKALKENYFHRLEKSKREIFSVNGNKTPSLYCDILTQFT